MTWAQFFRELATLRGTFHITVDKRIADDKNQCPILAVYNQKQNFINGNGFCFTAIDRLNLHPKFGRQIVMASDNSTLQKNSKIRRKLCRVLNLPVNGVGGESESIS